MSRRGRIRRSNTRERRLQMLLFLILMFSTGLSQLVGPTECPGSNGVVGYSDLLILQLDMFRMSNMTGGDDGGSYTLCPNTFFDFTIVPPLTDDILNDDVFKPPPEGGELNPIMIDARNTQLTCGENGLSSDSCVLLGGEFHVVIMAGRTGVRFSGLTFRQARDSSIIYSGGGGEISFIDCVWEENRGSGVILAVSSGDDTESPSTSPPSPTVSASPTITASPTLTPVPSENSIPTLSARPTLSAAPTAPSVSQSPSTTPQPTITPNPTSPTVSTQPSDVGGELPTISESPTSPTISQSPSGLEVPTVSASPTAPTVSSQPSDAGDSPSSSPRPTESTAPTSPTASLSPSTTPGPTATSSPTSPTVSTQPSDGGGELPTISESPTSPTVSQSPSGLEVPTVSASPTAPTVSSQPSDAGDSPSSSPRPTASAAPTSPTASLSPSATPGPTTTSNPTSPTVSTQPSDGGDQPTISESPTSPTISQSPSVVEVPTVSASPTSPTVSSQPSDAGDSPSSSPRPTASAAPTSPTASLSPSTTPGPTTTSNPTSPTVSTQPSDGGDQPTISESPTSPTFSQSPSVVEVPTVSASPTSPTVSSQPSDAGDSPSSSPRPTASAAPTSPTASPRPSTSPLPTSSQSPTSPTISIQPSDVVPAVPDDDIFVIPQGNARLFHPRFLQQSTDFSLSFQDCRFSSNNNDLSTLFVLRGMLALSNSEFRDNTASGAVVSVFSGSLSIDDTDFNNNEFTMFPAAVFLDSESRLLDNDDNCGSENVGDDDCNGVFTQTEPGDCSNPNDCVGECSEFTSSRCETVDCYDDWDQLSMAISSGTGEQFQLCTDRTLDVNDPIILDRSNIRIFCGEEGMRSGNCAITGGETQFEVTGTASDVLFVGVIFLDSENVAIKASGTASASVAFLDCAFSGHTGRSVIEIYNGGLDADEDDLGNVPNPPGQSMTVISVNCTLAENRMRFSPVSNFNGIAFFDRALFIGNRGQNGGMLVVKEGQASVTNTCFISSESTDLPGLVFLEQGTLSLRNSDNFGSENTVIDFPNCTEQFVETSGSCIEAVNSCEGTCQQFSSNVCLATDFDGTTVPTMAPSELVPTQFPSIVPTVSLLPTSADCFTEWDVLSAAVRDASMAGAGGTFIICPNTEMNVDMFPDADITPIVIASDDITIQCGDDGQLDSRCVVFGGQRQFQIEEDASDIRFRGIRFVGALRTSVSALGTREASAQFQDCAWTNGVGSQAVLIYGGDEDFPEDPTDGFVIPIEVPSMALSFVNCLFADNSASFSVITNVGGTVSIEETFFNDNSADFGVVATTGSGTINMIDNCFVSNTAATILGLIVVDANSTLGEANGNFGRENSVGRANNCTAIRVIQVDSTECIPFDADECVIRDLPPTGVPTQAPSLAEPTARPSNSPSLTEPTQTPSEPPTKTEPTPTPSEPPTRNEPTRTRRPTSSPTVANPTQSPTGEPTVEPTIAPSRTPRTPAPSFGCFDTWDRLSLAVLHACTAGIGGEFILCPDSFFEVDDFPDPLVTPIVIHSSDITIQCGDNGARSNNCVVSGGVTQFKLRNTIMNVEFTGVTFEKSRGMSIYAAATQESSAFFIDCEWRDNEGTSAILMMELERDETAMMLGVLRSNFTDNDVTDAAIVNVGGMLNIEESLFWRNRARLGAGGVVEGGTITVQNSCFVDNEGGAVTLRDDSSITRQNDNFGFGNGRCNGILDQDDEPVVIECGLACTEFDADTCSVMEFDSDLVPTASPTMTQSPICAPTSSPMPSQQPTTPRENTESPTAPPTDEPTQVPTTSPTGDRAPTDEPTQEPTTSPTGDRAPTDEPTQEPTTSPTGDREPTDEPTQSPSGTGPTEEPTSSPTGDQAPTDSPTGEQAPTDSPTGEQEPTDSPTVDQAPTDSPTGDQAPTDEPTTSPTGDQDPTASPTGIAEPTDEPTGEQTPTGEPTQSPTGMAPTDEPTASPTGEEEPTASPTQLTEEPTGGGEPTGFPTDTPTGMGPTAQPTNLPSVSPSVPPSPLPSTVPTRRRSVLPTNIPSNIPSTLTSTVPSSSTQPSTFTADPTMTEGPTQTEMSMSFNYDFFYNFDHERKQ